MYNLIFNLPAMKLFPWLGMLLCLQNFYLLYVTKLFNWLIFNKLQLHFTNGIIIGELIHQLMSIVNACMYIIYSMNGMRHREKSTTLRWSVILQDPHCCLSFEWKCPLHYCLGAFLRGMPHFILLSMVFLNIYRYVLLCHPRSTKCRCLALHHTIASVHVPVLTDTFFS